MISKDLKRKIGILIRNEFKPQLAKEIINKLKFFVNFKEEFGDFSTNLIFLLKKLAPGTEDKLIAKIKEKFKSDFSEIKIINNHLNFYFSDYFLLKKFRQVFKNLDIFFKLKSNRKKKIVIDYVSANPTGPLTLGNARGAVIGDVLANILKINGFSITKEYYINDRGLQIELLGKTILAHLGYLEYEENFYQGDYLQEIAQKIKKKIKPQEQSPEQIGQITASFILENYIKPTLRKFGTFHNLFLAETYLYQQKLDKKILKILARKKLLKKEGALFLTLTKLGENKDEVLIKQSGEPTYFFSDILHYYYKFFIKKINFDILIVASDHLDHVRRLKTALKIFGIKQKQLLPIIYQFVHLKRGGEMLRMSKRKGTFVTLDELIAQINSGVIRFFFLQKSPEMTIDFDLSLAQKESEENPYWYVQYAYVRLQSIINKAKKQKILTKAKNLDPQKVWFKLNQNKSTKQIIAMIIKFQEILILVTEENKPNLLIEYLIQLVQKIHSFYEQEKILPDPYKLAFVILLKNFLTFVFKILGIKPLEKI